MTFCLGMRTKEGLVGIADTRVTSGEACITARKVSVYQGNDWSVFMMFSGLRSVRDKALTYFEELYEHSLVDSGQPPERKLFKLVNLFAAQIRKVSAEDKAALEESGFRFNIHALMGGQMADDQVPRLFLIYPEGNWVEIGEGTPYHIIGRSGYGKPVLDRTFKYGDSMRFALKVGTLAFDSTRISAADVDFPMDIVLYANDSYQIVTHRFEKEDIAPFSDWWQERLRISVKNCRCRRSSQSWPGCRMERSGRLVATHALRTSREQESDCRKNHMTPFANSLLIGWQRNGDYAGKLIADLSEEQMVVQPSVGMNHPAWIFSHLNAYHPVLVAMLGGQPFDDPKHHPFGMLSKPEPDRSVYAAKAELLGAYHDGHSQVQEILAGADEKTFEQPMPLERWQGPFPTVGSALGYLMLAHEATHLGQISAWRRAQGLPSV